MMRPDIREWAMHLWEQLPAKERRRWPIRRIQPEHRPFIRILVWMAHKGNADARKALVKYMPRRQPIGRIALGERRRQIPRGKANVLDVFINGYWKLKDDK